MNRDPKNTELHQRILTTIMCRYDRPIMNNVDRARYVEYLVALTLGEGWEPTWDWAAWDCQHDSGVRLEVKQAAAIQSWDRGKPAGNRSPRFDIARRTGYSIQDGSRWRWVDCPGRPADLYVFAWHDESRCEIADQRDAGQWRFFVVAEQNLPKDQKSIGLTRLNVLASPSLPIAELRNAVEGACPAPGALKAALDLACIMRTSS